AVLKPQSQLAAYTAAKSAVAGLTRALAKELRDDRIRVNAVAPGTMKTADNLAQMQGAKVRWVELDELVAAVLYLASDEAHGVSGAVLHRAVAAHAPPHVSVARGPRARAVARPRDRRRSRAGGAGDPVRPHGTRPQSVCLVRRLDLSHPLHRARHLPGHRERADVGDGGRRARSDGAAAGGGRAGGWAGPA